MKPWLTDEKTEEQIYRETLNNTMQKLASSVTSLESTLAAQKLVLEQILDKTNRLEDNNNWRQEGQDIKSEIISLKGLFLSS